MFKANIHKTFSRTCKQAIQFRNTNLWLVAGFAVWKYSVALLWTFFWTITLRNLYMTRLGRITKTMKHVLIHSSHTRWVNSNANGHSTFPGFHLISVPSIEVSPELSIMISFDSTSFVNQGLGLKNCRQSGITKQQFDTCTPENILCPVYWQKWPLIVPEWCICSAW